MFGWSRSIAVTMVVMLLLLGLGGVLLTALAYRPKEQREDWWQWTERFTRSGITSHLLSYDGDSGGLVSIRCILSVGTTARPPGTACVTFKLLD